jgi:GNAT superfamily N-acetyltransferase
MLVLPTEAIRVTFFDARVSGESMTDLLSTTISLVTRENTFLELRDIRSINRLLKQLSESFVEMNEKAMRSYLHRTSAFVYVARPEVRGDVIGILTLNIFDTLTGRQSAIDDVVVDKNYRGLGIGKRLMTTAIKHAREADCKKIVLSSAEHRTAARGLYEKLGFERKDKYFELLLK